MDNTELIRALRSAAATTGLDAYVELMQKAADALSAIRPLAAPVTDDEIDAAFDALGLIRESTTVGEVRRTLEGFAAGRAAELDALRAATVAFALTVQNEPEALPEDARQLADWLEIHAFPLLEDSQGIEELFLHIIRAAMAKESK
jgi:chemotaxis protein histidine kinase CheA